MGRHDSILDWVAWLGCWLAGLVGVYLLAAPPVMMAAWRHSGLEHTPAIYQPVMVIIESNYGGPMVWYFNTVWHADIVLMGSIDGPPWYMVALYAVFIIALVAASLYPVFRWAFKRVRRNRLAGM